MPSLDPNNAKSNFAAFRNYVAERAVSTPGETYIFGDIHNCALAQFGRAVYGQPVTAGSFHISSPDGEHIPVIPDYARVKILVHACTWGSLDRGLTYAGH